MTESESPIIGVGGLGGSGTRLVSDILQSAGIYFGNDQNHASDTLSFTLFFNISALSIDEHQFQQRAEFFCSSLLGYPLSQVDIERLMVLAQDNQLQHGESWVLQRARKIVQNSSPLSHIRWGWKSPPTHFFAKQFLHCWPNFKFVHVYRNAYDMALSSNQNQLRYWAPHVWREFESRATTPELALRFWIRAHQEIQRIKQIYPSRVLLLPLEALCRAPQTWIDRLLEFSEIMPAADIRQELYTLPHPIRTLGRGDAATMHLTSAERAFINSFS